MGYSIGKGFDCDYLLKEVAAGREGYYTTAEHAGLEQPGVWRGAGARRLGLAGEVTPDAMHALYTRHLDWRDPKAHDRATWGQAVRLATSRALPSTAERYAALRAKEPRADAGRRAEMRAEAAGGRQPVVLFDLTWSAPKGVTLTQVGWQVAAMEARGRGDEAAAARWQGMADRVDALAQEAHTYGLAWLEGRAGYSRTGHHGNGQGRWIDAELLYSVHVQHDARPTAEHVEGRGGDPHLHAHGPIANLALCADGTARTPDSALLYQHHAAAGMVADRYFEARFSAEFGISFVEIELPGGGVGRDVDPAVVSRARAEEFSSRSRAVARELDARLSGFRADLGREPTAREQRQLKSQAVLASRLPKSHGGQTKDEQLRGWDTQDRAAGFGGLAQLGAAAAARHGNLVEPDGVVRDVVIERALEELTTGRSAKSAWSRSDAVLAIGKCLPPNLGIAAEDAAGLLETLTDRLLGHPDAVRLTPAPRTEHLPASARLADGSSVFARPGQVRYATRGTLVAETALREAAVERGARRLTAEQARAAVDHYARNGTPLGADQAAAVAGVLTSGARLEVLSAPAGTGKSFTVGAIARGWRTADADGRSGRVIGLAVSQAATEVLAGEGLDATSNVSAFLAAQQRITDGRPRGGDAALALSGGNAVVLDEASMVTTADLAAVHGYVRAAGGKLVLVGDAAQLTAVGAGGVFRDLTEIAPRYELTEVRRFDAAWEAAASLRLRDGDPSVAAEYDKHGRIVDGGTREQAQYLAARDWVADRLAGYDSQLIVGSNADAARLSGHVREELVRLGIVAADGVRLGLQGTYAGVGDRVEYRLNGWRLYGHEGNTTVPVNRRTGEVVEVRDDGGIITATPDGQRLVLPGAYVGDHLALAYASTAHAVQGRTVDRTRNVGVTDPYVPMTRGRESNTMYMTTLPLAADAKPGQTQAVDRLDARDEFARLVAQAAEPTDLSAHAVRDRAEAEARSARTLLAGLREDLDLALARSTGNALDRLTAAGRLTVEQRQQIAADPAYRSLDELLQVAELAGHDRAQVLTEAVGAGSFDNARSYAKVLHHRVHAQLDGQLTPQLIDLRELIPAGHDPAWTARLVDDVDRLDDRRQELGEQTAAHRDQWAVRALGPVPETGLDRLDWEDRAGWAALAREVLGRDSVTDPLGAAPPAGDHLGRVLFRTGHHALGLPEAGAEEAELSDGGLHARWHAWQRDLDAAPEYVADMLAETHSQARDARAAGLIWQARAGVEDDPAAADRLRAEAAVKLADADTLDQRAAELETVDGARSAWLVATAVTRDLAERARIEAAMRGIDLDDPGPRTTAAELLAEQAAGTQAEDPHREIADERDLADAAAARTAAHEDAVRGTAPDEHTPPEDADGEQPTDRATETGATDATDATDATAAPERYADQRAGDEPARQPAEAGTVAGHDVPGRVDDPSEDDATGEHTVRGAPGRGGDAARDDVGAVPTPTDQAAEEDLARDGGDRADGGPVPQTRRSDAQDDSDGAKDTAEGTRVDGGDGNRAQRREAAGERPAQASPPSLRETAVRADSEDRDPDQLRRVPAPDETAAMVERAKDATRELANRAADDAAADAAADTERADATARDAAQTRDTATATALNEDTLTRS
jgi:hypothetical protein